MVMKSVLIVVVAITLSPSSAQILSQSAMSSILQNILSPTNTEKAMQLIKMAASRSSSMPGVARAGACDPSPARFASTDYLPARTVANEMPVRVAGDGGTQKILRQAPVGITRAIQPRMMDSLVMPKEIFQSFPMAVQQESVLPCQTLSPAFNPYLTVASPVSALSPGNLPPPTQSRGQFLRKIPIPPPTL